MVNQTIIESKREKKFNSKFSIYSLCEIIFMRIYQVTAEEAEVISYFLFGGIYAKANKPHSFRGIQIQSHALAEQAKAKAYAAFSAGDFSTAVRHFSTAMSVGPSNYLLYSNRSAAYARLHKYSEALADA